MCFDQSAIQNLNRKPYHFNFQHQNLHCFGLLICCYGSEKTQVSQNIKDTTKAVLSIAELGANTKTTSFLVLLSDTSLFSNYFRFLALKIYIGGGEGEGGEGEEEKGEKAVLRKISLIEGKFLKRYNGMSSRSV